jgi:hypothetical protein
MRIQRLPAAAALLALAAAALFADRLDDALARSPYAAADRDRVAALLRGAAERGLPLELTLPRLEQGLARRAPAATVLDVITREIQRLERARDLLAALEPPSALADQPAAWQRGATLLAWGAADAEVSALAAASTGRRERFVQAGGLLVSLADWGLERRAALNVAAAAAESALAHEELAGIAALFTAGRRQRLDPVSLARSIVEELPRARTLRQLREKTLYE